MPEHAEIVQRVTQRRQLGRPAPRRFSDRARDRFERDRRAVYLDEHSPHGDPTPTQSRLIGELIECEWQRQKLQAEADATTDSKVRGGLLKLVDRARQQIVMLGRDLTNATARREAREGTRPSTPESPLAKSLREHPAGKTAKPAPKGSQDDPNPVRIGGQSELDL